MNRVFSIVLTVLCLLAAVVALLAPKVGLASERVNVVVQTFASERVQMTHSRLAYLEETYRDEFDAGLRAHFRKAGVREQYPSPQSASRLVQNNGITLGVIRLTYPGKGHFLSITGYESGKLFVVKCTHTEGTLPSIERGPCARKLAEVFGVALSDSERP